MPPTVRGWKDENKYDVLIRAAAAKYGVPVPIVKGVMAHESGFNPLAMKLEAPRPSLPPTGDHPKGGDESRGLLQLLARTARALDYTGPLDGLYQPALNIELGTRLLANTLRQARGNIAAALSAYNGGFSKVRPYDGKRTTNDPASPYINQDYVNIVSRYIAYFQEKEARAAGGEPDFTDVTGGSSSTAPAAGSPPAKPSSPALGAIIGVAVLAFLAWLLRGNR